MIIGDLVRGFWNSTLTVLHHLNPFDNVARHPEPMDLDDEDSFTIGGPASRTRSLAPTPSAPSPVNRRSYQPHPAQEKSSAASSARSPLAQARRPLPTSTSPSRLMSPYVKVAATSTGQSSASTSRKPATPHPGKTPVVTPGAKAVKSVTSPTRVANRRTVSPVRSVKRTNSPTRKATSKSPTRKVTSTISGRTRSRSRARSAVKESALGTITEEKKKVKKTPAEKKKSASKRGPAKALKRKSDEGVVRRSRRVKHEEGAVMTPEELVAKGRRKASASTGARAVKKAKI